MEHISHFCLMPIFSIQWNQEFAFLWWFAGCLEIQLWDKMRSPMFSHVCSGQLPLGPWGRTVPTTAPGELWAAAGVSILQSLVHMCERLWRTQLPCGPWPLPRSRPRSPPRVPHRVLPSGPSSNLVKLFLFILGGMRGCWWRPALGS